MKRWKCFLDILIIKTWQKQQGKTEVGTLRALSVPMKELDISHML